VPIRTPRGRAAAYRPIWQWPLRSPVRLAATVLVVLALAFGVTLGLTALRGPQPPAAGARTTAGPTAAAPGSTAGAGRSGSSGTAAAPSSEPSPLPLAAAPSEALVAVERWSRAWVRPPAGISDRQWLDNLRPLTTDQYLGVLSAVDPQNIPATEVTGRATAVRVADRSVQAEVPTDALTLRVLVVETEQGWRVAGYDRA
jgi:hypothetical protein